MNSRIRVGTSRGELIVQEAEEKAKSECLPLTGRIGLNNPTGNGADLLMVFYGKKGEATYECTAFNDVTRREAYRQRLCDPVELNSLERCKGSCQ